MGWIARRLGVVVAMTVVVAKSGREANAKLAEMPFIIRTAHYAPHHTYTMVGKRLTTFSSLFSTFVYAIG